MSIFQEHVLPNAKEDLLHSELFTNEDAIDPKDKEFVSSISNKSSKELTAKELEKLKYIVRKNISVSIRVKIWLLLSGGAEITYKSLYTESCQELFTEDGFIPDGEDANTKQFLTYYLTAAGGNKLRRVLCVTKHLNPDITYCPLLEPIVSILLHFLDEESTFAVVSGLLSGTFTAPFLDQTKIENVTTDATLQDLFKATHKKGFSRLVTFFKPEEKSLSEKVVLFPSWRMTIFENLDFVSLTRLLDCLFAEGVKMLYRIGVYLLEAFYEYSLTFKQLHCTTPHDLVATIGQFTESLKLSAEDLLKSATKINITTKQVVKCKQENSKLYKASQLEWTENTVIKHVVAVDLRQVSNIIQPHQWQEISEWLPARIQIKQPFLLFTTDNDGYNLKTLYQLCEDEEETLMIVQTSTNEILGAYLSVSLLHRHDGKNNMSYFGTGETFLFTLSPCSRAYHWGRGDWVDSLSQPRPQKKTSHYVFVDTKPLIKDEEDASSKTEVKKNRKVSMKRRLSKKLSFAPHAKPGFDRSVSRSAYSKRDKVSVSLHPLNAINIKRSTYSVPKHLCLGDQAGAHPAAAKLHEIHSVPANLSEYSNSGKKKLMSAQTIDVADMKRLQKYSNVVIDDSADGAPTTTKPRSQTAGGARPKLQKTQIIEEEEAFDVIEESTAPPKIGSPPKVTVNLAPDNTDKKAINLFISCDNIRIIVGGGGGEGLWMDGELAKGRSTKCETFNNSPLTSNEDGDFSIIRVDVFGFQ